MNAKVTASDQVTVDAIDTAHVTASGKAAVEAFDTVHVEASENSLVHAHDGTSVNAAGNSRIHVYGNVVVKREPGVSLAAVPVSKKPFPKETNTAENFEKNYIALANTNEFRHNPVHAGRLLIKNSGHGNRENILRMLHEKGCSMSRDIRAYLLKVHAVSRTEHRNRQETKPGDDYSMER
jgi:hypothetical protein